IQLLKTLAELGIKGRMLSWIISFLSNRKIQVILEDQLSSIYAINTGVPQGSILSPILFIILLCTLPELIPVISKEFADDIVFSITADTLEDAELKMQDAIERLLEWCNKIKLTLQPTKTKVMCFTKKADKTPRLTLEGSEIEVVQTFKYLGMTLDAPTLTWGAHINMLKSECMARINIMRALAGTTWGANRECQLKIYNAMIKSKIAYGSQVLISASQSNLDKLEVVQNMALRIATGAWNNTQISTLQCEANMPPLDLYLQAQSIKYYYKLKNKQESHPVKEQIFNDRTIINKIWTRNIFKKPFVLKAEEIIHNWNLPMNQQIEIKSHIVPPWFHLEKYVHIEMDIPCNKSMGVDHKRQIALNMLRTKYNNFRKIFTDGSKTEDGATGAGFYIEDRERRECWQLEPQNSIAGAEMSAIQQATNWIQNQPHPDNIVILTDSQTSLHLIKQRKLKAYRNNTSKIQNNLIDLTSKGWNLHFQWIPSHIGIEGNDIADEAANLGRTEDILDTPLEDKDVNKLVDRIMHERWQLRWEIERHRSIFGLIKQKLKIGTGQEVKTG
ncbi:unnamed protein product, partial [Meganyctiphanes norvegica]